ncbi:putative replication origin binding protein, partial [Varanus komodoensis]
LRGTEAAVCHPNLETRKVCCLLGTRIWHVKDRVECLVRSGGHQLLLVIHVGTNDMARQGVVRITRDFEALGKKLRELKAQVTFSSILPVWGFGPGRDRRISEVNDWLRLWCRKECFELLTHGTQFLANELLARDGLHLTMMGKRSFGDALVSFVRKKLSQWGSPVVSISHRPPTRMQSTTYGKKYPHHVYISNIRLTYLETS